MKRLEDFGSSPRLLTSYSQVFDGSATKRAIQALAGFRVREHRSIAERDCGAGGRRGRKRRTLKSDEQEVSEARTGATRDGLPETPIATENP